MPVREQFDKRKMLTESLPEVYKDGLILPEKINTSSLIIKNLNDSSILMKKLSTDEFSAVGCAKIMTAISALESGNTQMDIELPFGVIEHTNVATLYDLINMLMITQNNSVANIIAEAVGGSVEDFVSMMNKKMYILGAEHTKFVSPTGFEVGNITTAEDTCKLVEYALNNQHFCQIFRNKSYIINRDGMQMRVSTLNPLLRERRHRISPPPLCCSVHLIRS